MADINGTTGNDFLNGTPDADRIEGGDGHDQLRGNDGDDTLNGGSGNDLLRGGAGIDSFDGGEDNGADNPAFGTYGDRISFYETRATQGVIADLRTGIISNDGFGNVETMTGIESLGGDTAYVDVFHGDDGNNGLLASRGDQLHSYGGDDWIQTSAAAAIVDGGAGFDTLQLSNAGFQSPDSNGDGVAENVPPATAGWVVDLTTGYVADGYGNTGSVYGIEMVFGTELNDVLFGGAGDDSLNGGAGHDLVEGRGGNDNLAGGDGDDLLRGGDGDDLIDGGGGIDRISFFGATAGITVDLNLDGIAQNTGQGFDTLIGIEHASGTVFDDVITGNGGDNWIVSGSDGSGSSTGNDILSGGGGNDLIEVGIGNHVMDGGDGIDTARFYGNSTHISSTGVTASLALQGEAQDTEQGMMVLTGFENLSGSAHDDSLTGDGGANLLAGDNGNDVLNGGAGDDTLYGDGRITVDTHGFGGSGPIVTVGDNALFGNPPGDDVLHGGEGNDTLHGGGGNDVLDGGSGADVMDGGAGDDVFHVDQYDDSVIEAPGGGTDELRTSLDYSIGGHAEIENLTATGAGNTFLGGNSKANVITGNAGNNYIVGEGGNDITDGSDGNDIASFQLPSGTAGNVVLIEGSGADEGRLLVQIVDGGIAQTFLKITITGPGSAIVEGVGIGAFLGTDTLSNIEDLNIFVQAAVPSDPPAPNQFVSLSLVARQYGEFVSGSDGNDVIDLSAYPGATNVNGNRGDDSITGNDAGNYMIGGAGDDTISGGNGAGFDVAAYHLPQGIAGALRVVAGTGADLGTLIVERVEGAVVEAVFRVSVAEDGTATVEGLGSAAFLGTDTVRNVDAIDFNSDTGFTHIMIPGQPTPGTDELFGWVDSDVLVGGDSDDALRGNAGDDILRGGAGGDFLVGGLGNDLIDGGAGIDRASFYNDNPSLGGATVSLLLQGVAQNTGSSGFDVLVGIEHLNGTVFADTFIGDGNANWLWGGGAWKNLDGTFSANDDTLIAGGGDDLMTVGIGNHVLDGGEGSDAIEYFDQWMTGGVTVSLALQGTAQDTGWGSVTLTGIENLTGSLFGDSLTGDGSDNILGGGEGDDSLAGGGGNDLLLGDGYYNIDGFGTGAFYLVEAGPFAGNDLLDGGAGDDRLVGGNGNDVLDGGTGADFMDGGEGDDVFHVDQHGDIVIEAPGGGIDEVRSAIDYGLGGIPDIENLRATGTGNIFLGGNSGANVITGNGGDNYIVGEGGDDTLDGGAGRDIASFQLSAGTSGDIIMVEGSGADAGKLLVQLVNGGVAETFLKVEITGAGSAIVEGVGIGTFLGTDSVSNIEELHVFVPTTDGSPLPSNQFVAVPLAIQQFGEWLNGSHGDDVIDIGAFPGASNASGGYGDDSLIGTAADNYLIGEGGDDTLDGGAGRDIASFQLPAGTTGDIIMVEGSGADAGKLLVQLVNGGIAETFLEVIVTATGSASIAGVGIGEFLGADTVANVEELHVFVRTTDGSPTPPNQFLNINLTVRQFGDFVAGSEGDDVIDLAAYPGAVNANGNHGDDTIIGNSASNYMIGGAGDDTISGGSGGGFDVAAYHLRPGVAGALRVVAGTGADAGTLIVERVDGAVVEAVFRVSLAANGTATVEGLGSAAYLGVDQVSNVEALDFNSDTGFTHITVTAQGTPGNDFINGNNEANLVFGTEGDDQLRGNGGADLIYGGAGNDLLRGGAGTDHFDGGADNGGISPLLGGYGDRISFFEVAATQGVIADLRTGIISNDGFGNVETMTGIESLGGDTAFVDTFHGDDGTNTLLASRGDRLYGHGGDDFIQISAAAAIVDGGNGIDTLQLTNSGFQSPDTNGDGFAETIAPATAGWFVDLAANYLADGYGNSGSVIGIEKVYGTALRDTLLGSGADDTIDGGADHDFLEGRGGNDSLAGGAGDDLLRGGAGDDLIDGGAGLDRASFSGTVAGVTVDLNLAGIAQNTGQGMDTLVSIEHVTGTVFDDVITGDGADNWIGGGSNGSGGTTGNDILSGGGGNDLIEVGIGNHVIDGGTGIDTARLYGNGSHISTAGVTVSLALQGSAQDSEQGMMTLTGFENLSGSLHDDNLAGDGGANLLAGDGGNDLLSGGGGNDRLYGDGRIGVDTHGTGGSGPIMTIVDTAVLGNPAGNDVLDGGDGDDVLDGGNGDDVLHGGAGADVVFGGGGSDQLFGGDGDDLLIDGSGDDTVDGGAGYDIAAIYFAPETLGSFSSVPGTGPDAGKTFIIRTFPGGSEQVAVIVTLGAVTTVTGLNSAAYLGTNTMTGVERLLFSTVPADPFTDPGAPGYTLVELGSLSGTVADGYIADATVFFDSNGNGNLDTGEVATVTDGNGAFTFARAGSGPLVAFGGVNIDTGLANEMVLRAPDSSTVVNPLTTLVAAVMAESGGTVGSAAAEVRVKAALGIDPSINLLTTDLIAGAASGSASALAAQKSAVIVVTILTVADDLAEDGDGQGAALGALAALIVEAPAGSTVDITDAAVVGEMLGAAAPGADVSAAAAAVAASAEAISEADSLDALAEAQSAALLTGNDLDNDLTGGARNDELSGLGGDDSLAGMAGDDLLDGGRGEDILLGGDGDDVLRGGAGADLLDGGDGIDTADYSNAPAISFLKVGVVVSLDSQAWWNTEGDTLVNIENVRGSAHRDVLAGNALANVLWGGDGEDLLNGGGGNDSLFGEGGSDLLVGGAGFDRLSGGALADLFSFGAIGDISQGENGQWTGRDEILDFEAGTAGGAIDLIDLSGIDANTGRRGDDAFKFIGTQAFSRKAGELHLVDQGVDGDGRRMALVEGDVDGDGVADFSLLVHYQGIIGASDFIL